MDDIGTVPVVDLKVKFEGRKARRRSSEFRRLMSMDTIRSMSFKNLLGNNAVFRKRASSVAINMISRVFILGMNVLLVLLSTAYCISQLSEVHLKLFNECEPKTLDEIHHHSYLAGLQEDGSVDVNFFSQGGVTGKTGDSCWTTHSYELNSDDVWNSNVYEHKWDIHIDYKVILFALTSLYAACVLVYNLINMVRDIYHLKRNTVHTLAEATREQLNERETAEHAWSSFTSWLGQSMKTENAVWVLGSVFMEFVEFGVITTSLLLYNGYNWNDPNYEHGVNLAEKPRFIRLFALGLAANMFGSAFLWLTYIGAPNTCYGLAFRFAFFFVEDLSDLFYTMFPAIVVYNDTYNANTDDLLVLVGQFRVHEFMAFASRFFVLLSLCVKTHHLSFALHAKLVNRYYAEFGFEDLGSSWIQEDDPHKNKKRCFLSAVSILYIVSGSFTLVLVGDHFYEARVHCNSIRKADLWSDLSVSKQQHLLLESNPELFLWDSCMYQTFPFTNNERQRCQCRIFFGSSRTASVYSSHPSITENDESPIAALGLTDSIILHGLLKNNIMLEKFSFIYLADEFKFNTLVVTSPHMKAFSLVINTNRDININGEGWGDFIPNWPQLEYLQFPVRQHLSEFQHLKSLSSLRYLSIDFQAHSGSLPKQLEPFCSLENLEMLFVSGYVGSIPRCFANLRELRVLQLGFQSTLTEIPFSILDLPKLQMVDLSKGPLSKGLTWKSLMEYNLPPEIDRNDSVGIHLWLDAHFSFNENAEFYFQSNPICRELSSDLPHKLRELLEASCDNACPGGLTTGFCEPRLIGDGFCHHPCNTANCNYDGGDCMQLCFVKELSNCTWKELLNDKCDESCDTEYCSALDWGHRSTGSGLLDPDFENCKPENSGPHFDFSECPLSSTMNEYLDPSITWEPDDVCLTDWIGDETCDDLCRTSECYQDNGDCKQCYGVCQTAYERWVRIPDRNYHMVSLMYYCEEIWESMITEAGEFDGSDDCEGTMRSLDFNQDGNLNFREYSALIGRVELGFGDSRALQINCSSCVPTNFLDRYNM